MSSLKATKKAIAQESHYRCEMDVRRPEILVSLEALRVTGLESCWKAYLLLSELVESLVTPGNQSTRRVVRPRQRRRSSSVYRCRSIAAREYSLRSIAYYYQAPTEGVQARGGQNSALSVGYHTLGFGTGASQRHLGIDCPPTRRKHFRKECVNPCRMPLFTRN